jgi:hypothetical protein
MRHPYRQIAIGRMLVLPPGNGLAASMSARCADRAMLCLFWKHLVTCTRRTHRLKGVVGSWR